MGYYFRAQHWIRRAVCNSVGGWERQQNEAEYFFFVLFSWRRLNLRALALFHSRGACSDAAVLLVPLQTQRLKQIKLSWEEQMGQVRSWEIIQSVRHRVISIFPRRVGAVAQQGSFWHSTHVRQFWNKSCIRCSVSKFPCPRASLHLARIAVRGVGWWKQAYRESFQVFLLTTLSRVCITNEQSSSVGGKNGI